MSNRMAGERVENVRDKERNIEMKTKEKLEAKERRYQNKGSLPKSTHMRSSGEMLGPQPPESEMMNEPFEQAPGTGQSLEGDAVS